MNEVTLALDAIVLEVFHMQYELEAKQDRESDTMNKVNAFSSPILEACKHSLL